MKLDKFLLEIYPPLTTATVDANELRQLILSKRELDGTIDKLTKELGNTVIKYNKVSAELSALRQDHTTLGHKYITLQQKVELDMVPKGQLVDIKGA